jgi:hypothetical protein
MFIYDHWGLNHRHFMTGVEILPTFHEHLIVYEKIHNMPAAEFCVYEFIFSRLRLKGPA